MAWTEAQQQEQEATETAVRSWKAGQQSKEETIKQLAGIRRYYRGGGGVMGSPQQKAAAEKARLATLEMRRLQEIKRQEQAAKETARQSQIQQQVQTQTIGGQLQGWQPQYSGGKLLGFTSPTGEFLPKEVTIGTGGLFQPERVTTRKGTATKTYYADPLGLIRGVKKEVGEGKEFKVSAGYGGEKLLYKYEKSKREVISERVEQPIITSEPKAEEKDVRGIWFPVKFAHEFMKETPSPQEWLGGLFKEKGIDVTAGMIGDIERARIKEGEPSSLKFVFGKLGEAGKGIYKDVGLISKKAEKSILEHKESPLISLAAKTETPQEKLRSFFKTTISPQERTSEFFRTTPSPQEFVSGKLDIKTLKKTPVVSMITDIEIAHQKRAKDISSGQFFFEKLAESTPITSDIMKGYKKSEQETLRGFITSTAGKGYEEAYTDISEYLTYKGTKLFAKAREEKYIYQPSSKIIGAGFGAVGKYQLYGLPAGVGAGLFVSPFVEKAIKGKGALPEYIRAHPFETTAIVVLGGLAAYKPIKELVSVWGKKYIPIEKLTIPEVISGQKTFPTARGGIKEHLELFRRSKYRLPGEIKQGVWHATGRELPAITKTLAGKSNLPGLYTSYAASPYFLRTGAESGYGLIGTSFSLKSPALLRIYPQDILGMAARRIKPGKALSYKWVDDVTKGYAYIPAIKSEVEAVIPEATKLSMIASKYYTIYKGHPVPLPQYQTLAEGVISGAGKGAVTFEKVLSSYSSLGGKQAYLISPSSIARTIISSYKPSVSRVSYGVSSYKPSYKVSYKAYKPSYVSRILSYKPSISSYKPSYSLTRKYGSGYSYYAKGKPRVSRGLPPPIAWFREAKRRMYPRVKRLPVQPQAYTPSLTAMIFQITGKKPSPILKRFSAGYIPGIRPIISETIFKRIKRRKRRRRSF